MTVAEHIWFFGRLKVNFPCIYRCSHAFSSLQYFIQEVRFIYSSLGEFGMYLGRAGCRPCLTWQGMYGAELDHEVKSFLAKLGLEPKVGSCVA